MKSAFVHTPKGSKKPSDDVFKAAVVELSGGIGVRQQAAYRFLRTRCGYTKERAKAAVKG